MNTIVAVNVAVHGTCPACNHEVTIIAAYSEPVKRPRTAKPASDTERKATP